MYTLNAIITSIIIQAIIHSSISTVFFIKVYKFIFKFTIENLATKSGLCMCKYFKKKKSLDVKTLCNVWLSPVSGSGSMSVIKIPQPSVPTESKYWITLF